jgi:putative membrane protein
VITWLLGLLGINLGAGGFLAAIVNLIVAAVILMISDRFISGMKVNGFTGALIAAVAIGVVGWLVTWLLSLLGINL